MILRCDVFARKRTLLGLDLVETTDMFECRAGLTQSTGLISFNTNVLFRFALPALQGIV